MFKVSVMQKLIQLFQTKNQPETDVMAGRWGYFSTEYLFLT